VSKSRTATAANTNPNQRKDIPGLNRNNDDSDDSEESDDSSDLPPSARIPIVSPVQQGRDKKIAETRKVPERRK
jgi:hypothetical protein